MKKDTRMVENVNRQPDEIINDLGGCGWYQVWMTVTVHLMKTVFCFSTSNLLISTVTPKWWCVVEESQNNFSAYMVDNVSMVDNVPMVDNTSSYRKNEMSCTPLNGTTCSQVLYDENLSSLVSEFDLICSMDFIPSAINSVQLAGQLTGNLVSGQLADLFGRKPPFFASIVLLIILHVVGFFAVTWTMFAVSTYFTGVAAGFFFTIQFNLLSEFTLARWRVWVVGFPSWPIQQCLFALIAWLLHDWRYLQLMTAIATVPCLFAWCIIPESFRWHIAHDRAKQATEIINSVAKCNKHELSNAENILQELECATKKTGEKYTFIHLFRSKKTAKITLVLMVIWLALGIVGYGIYFGIQKLAGNIYLNMLLFSLFAIPSKSIAIWLQNRIGRRYTTVLCFIVVSVAGLTVGILKTLDAPNIDMATNVLAITANTGIAAAWASVQTMTVELYPTVIRNIGFGTVSTVGGLASIWGPQLAYLETYLSGLLYYSCGAVSILGVFCVLSLPETKDRNLQDRIVEETKDSLSASETEKDNKTSGHEQTNFSEHI